MRDNTIPAPPTDAEIDAQASPNTVDDGSKPLKDPREEKIATLLLTGMAKVHAFKATSPKPCKYNSARVQVSRIVSKPYFARRLAWLTAHRTPKVSQSQHGLAPEPSQHVDTPQDTRKPKTGVMSRDELIRELSALVRSAENEGTRVSAANSLAKLAYDSAETIQPSPEQVIEWISAHAGEQRRFKPGLVALMAWCKAGLDDLRGVLAELEHTTGSSDLNAETPQASENSAISSAVSANP